MLNKFKLFFCVVISILSFSACDKEVVCELPPYGPITVDATLYWTGEYAVDGCGFILEYDNQSHKFENESEVPTSYKNSESSAVEVKIIDFQKPTRSCQTGASFNQVKLLEIRRK